VGARMGDPDAIARLAGPGLPDSVAYLLGWADTLAQWRTVGPHGALEGVTPQLIESWARLYDIRPLPHEVDALITLDVLMRFPDAGEDEP
jgi:hypothetical protein